MKMARYKQRDSIEQRGRLSDTDGNKEFVELQDTGHYIFHITVRCVCRQEERFKKLSLYFWVFLVHAYFPMISHNSFQEHVVTHFMSTILSDGQKILMYGVTKNCLSECTVLLHVLQFFESVSEKHKIPTFEIL